MTAPDLTARAAHLASALAMWASRDDSTAQPEVRQAANTAMAGIDAMLAELHAARSALVAEIRASDDATDARVDAMLAARRAGIRGQSETDLPAVSLKLTSGAPGGAA